MHTTCAYNEHLAVHAARACHKTSHVTLMLTLTITSIGGKKLSMIDSALKRLSGIRRISLDAASSSSSLFLPSRVFSSYTRVSVCGCVRHRDGVCMRARSICVCENCLVRASPCICMILSTNIPFHTLTFCLNVSAICACSITTHVSLLPRFISSSIVDQMEGIVASVMRRPVWCV